MNQFEWVSMLACVTGANSIVISWMQEAKGWELYYIVAFFVLMLISWVFMRVSDNVRKGEKEKK